MDVIDKINLRLAEIGKTGAEMSRALNLSNSIYSQWNTRKTKPSKKNILKIASYLEVPVDYLLDTVSQENSVHLENRPEQNENQMLVLNEPVELSELRVIFFKLNSEGRKRLMSHARYLTMEADCLMTPPSTSKTG